MGFSAQVQSPQTSGGSGKGSPVASAAQQVSEPQQTQQPQQPSQPMGKGGYTNSATSGQPRMGAPNQYPNTVGQWDNTQQQRPMMGGGKGKG
jgi:hypothetical protein